MIAYLQGTVRQIRKNSLIVLCSSIGLEVFVLHPLEYNIGQDVEFFTYQQFREDGQSLFGFESEEQFELFALLTGVKGLGCKTVMSAMSAMDCRKIIQAVEAADAGTLKKLPGIGAKTAGQIILDLKGKLVDLSPDPEKENEKQTPAGKAWSEVTLALESLGYRSAQIEQARAALADSMDLNVDQLLRKALRELSLRR